MRQSLLTLLRKPTTILVGANFASLALGLLSAALQARLLGPQGRGELATAMVPAVIAGMLLCIGLPDYFARQAAKGKDLRHLSASAAVLTLAVGLVAVGPYIWVAQFVSAPGSQAWLLLVVYASLTPLTTFGYCLASIAVGAGWWKTVAVAKLLPQVLSVAGLAVMSGSGASPAGVGMVLIGSTVIGFLVPLFKSKIWPYAKVSFSALGTALRFGIRGWTAGSIALLNQRIDLLLLTALATKEDLGFYAVATTLAAVLNAVSNSVAMPTRNRVATGDVHIVPPTTAATMATTLLLAAVVVMCLPLLVTVVLGPNFLPAMPVMIILLAAQVPLSGIIIMTQSLVGAGKPGLPFLGEVAALVTTALMVLLLVPLFGVTAAAWANLAGNAVSFATLLALSFRHVSRQSLWKYMVISPTRIASLVKGTS